jgi:hypothetical protein
MMDLQMAEMMVDLLVEMKVVLLEFLMVEMKADMLVDLMVEQ